MKGAVPTILTVSALFLSAYASSGDRTAEFGNCIHSCNLEHCGVETNLSLPLALRLTRWSCSDNCKYECMHFITERDIGHGKEVQQYYGKWPFWRFAGIQEPASVAFSLLNLWAHARGASKVRKKISETHPMRSLYLTWSLVSINAWLWSTVFHTRDLPTTEKLDYFSAALAIMYALYYTIIRLFHLYSSPQGHLTLTSRSWKFPKQRLLAAICILTYISHISYLTFLPRFDYTYNMVFNLTLGLLHNALWAIYSLPATITLIRRFPSRAKTYRPNFVSKAGLFVFLTTAATGLELFDFPPWGMAIDAHALWHLATAPIALFWYDFLVEDALDSSWRETKS